MAPPKKNRRGCPITGSNIASEGHSCQICIRCGKEFNLAREKEEAKLRFSKEDTSRFVNEEGFFFRGNRLQNRRRDQMCNDCFHIAVVNDKDIRAFTRSWDRPAKESKNGENSMERG